MSVSHTQSLSTIPKHRQSSTCTCAEVFPPTRTVSPGNFVLQPPYPRCVVVETINPTALSPLSRGDHRSRDLGTVHGQGQYAVPRALLLTLRSQQHMLRFWLSFPTVLPYRLSFARRLLPTFWSSARFLSDVFSPSHTNIKCVPHCCLPTPLLTPQPYYSTLCYSTPCYPTRVVLHTPYP